MSLLSAYVYSGDREHFMIGIGKLTFDSNTISTQCDFKSTLPASMTITPLPWLIDND